MSLDHDAIRKAYPEVTTIDDGTGAFDALGEKVTLEQYKIDDARLELDKLNYRYDRAPEYPSIGDQLDALYHAGAFPADMAEKIKAVKDRHPKPS